MDVDKLAKPKDKQTKPKDNASKPVATLSLNVYTETFSRSHISFEELADRQVGHTWISLDFEDRKSALQELNLKNPTRRLVRNEGGTSMGFWPLKYRGEAFRPEAERDARYTTDRERARGYTPGAGASRDQAHEGYDSHQILKGSNTLQDQAHERYEPEKSVPGRVEEPDRAHQDDIKISKKYKLTYDQVKSMLGYVDASRNKDYHLRNYNCTTFAIEAVKYAGQTAPSGSFLDICYPNALYKELYQKHKNDKNDKSISVADINPSNHEVTGRDIDVTH